MNDYPEPYDCFEVVTFQEATEQMNERAEYGYTVHSIVPLSAKQGGGTARLIITMVRTSTLTNCVTNYLRQRED